jgi:hypothetical protein
MRTYLFVVATLGMIGCASSSSSGDDAAGVDAAARPDADTSPDSGPPQEESKVYAHSPTKLYRIDSNDLSVHEIGAFGAALGTSSMTDIAVDKDGVMKGVSLSKIWDIDADTGTASNPVAFGGSGNLTSLTFVPKDPNDPNSDEDLVTAGDGGNVYQIKADGSTTLLGNYGMTNGKQIISSGDIVSVRGLGTLATVDVVGETEDYLAWIDPANGWKATLIGTGTGKDKIFGLGFWGGTIFGFVDDGSGAGTGELVTIDKGTGVAAPATMSQFRWYGAGVTTKAPIIGLQ